MATDHSSKSKVVVTESMIDSFKCDGYLIIRNILDNEEISVLKSALEHPAGVMSYKFDLNDMSRRKTSVAVWAHPGNDITGIVARANKVAGTFEQLLGGEVYHYHSKVIQKDPGTGGAHHWHQDYGYWYHNGNLTPNMGTVWIAVDKVTRNNSCLQLLKGSHHSGRIEHVRVKGNDEAAREQIVADSERVKHIQNMCEHVYFEANPGDAIFFHSNVLHRSEPNNSNNRRAAFLVAYNRKDNSSVYEHQFPQFTPLEKVDDDMIKSCTNITDLSGKNILSPNAEFRAQLLLEYEDKFVP